MFHVEVRNTYKKHTIIFLPRSKLRAVDDKYIELISAQILNNVCKDTKSKFESDLLYKKFEYFEKNEILEILASHRDVSFQF